jgi:hypothetical protein
LDLCEALGLVSAKFLIPLVRSGMVERSSLFKLFYINLRMKLVYTSVAEYATDIAEIVLNLNIESTLE